MNIGLVDVDGHNFPNLPLMKLAAWHRAQGHHVEFAQPFEEYDILFKSKVFTWTPETEELITAKEIIRGGTGCGDYAVKLPQEVESICPDYSLYGCEHAYGFLTRGCSRECGFCVVPRKEGQIQPAQDIEEFLGGMQSAVLLDNNVLACSWGIEQIKKIVALRLKVDFLQGLDIRLIENSPALARLLAKVRWLNPVRLACDHIKELPTLIRAVKLLRDHHVTPARYRVYMLVTDDIDSAITRARKMKELNLDPFAQAYRPLNGQGRITKRQRDICRWINRPQIFKIVDWEEYNRK